MNLNILDGGHGKLVEDLNLSPGYDHDHGQKTHAMRVHLDDLMAGRMGGLMEDLM